MTRLYQTNVTLVIEKIMTVKTKSTFCHDSSSPSTNVSFNSVNLTTPTSGAGSVSKTYLLMFPSVLATKERVPSTERDELKEFNLHQNKYRLNPFRTCFSRVAAAMATRPAHIAGTASHARNPSTASDLSSSSQEDKSRKHQSMH